MLPHSAYSSPHIRFACSVALLASAMAQNALRLPTISGESLAGQKIVLPDAAAGKVAVLIFGFTKASKGPTSAWAEKLQTDFGTRPEFELYQLPVLEAVPHLFRGIVISGIRKGVLETKRERFVPILQREAELKKLVHYDEADDAYLVVLDRSGNILDQSHDFPDQASYSRLQTRIESILRSK